MSSETPVRPTVLFVTRNPVVRETSGSTTLILTLLELLRAQGCEVTVLSTLAYSRSPRVAFQARVPLPEGVRYRAPGYVQAAGILLRSFALKAWARDVCRASTKVALFRPLCLLMEWMYGDRLYTNAWDLTLPTAKELRVAKREAERIGASCVIANYAIWAPLFAELPAETTKIIMAHDLLSARVERMLAAGDSLDCPQISEAEELQWLNAADVVLAAQDTEATYLRERLQARVMTQPIVMKLQEPSQEVTPHRCLFVGGHILPNVSGMAFFLDEVWPRVRQAVPDAEFVVAGTIGQAELAGFQQPGVVRLGRVPRLEGEYNLAAVCVVPLVVGSGIKIKLLEALSFGKACVATSVGVQGLEGLTDGTIAVADTAEAFADEVIALLLSAERRKTLEQGAVRLAREQFGPSSEAVRSFLHLLLG
ncbi:MAG: glycosyltransferase family 4 protein [Acidobacteriaceae bacterium]|nr:glycosyltransferase family 4 protein [Acidobacteriaceae bacterium]